MKKNVFVLMLLLFCFLKVNGYDLNLDIEVEFFHTKYIKNDAFIYLASQTTLTSIDSQEKIRVKFKEKIDQIKFDFDTRFYLKPNQNKFDYFIDSAYFSFENGPFVLYAGKQRIKWGVGYTWNPTDKLQPQKNILDPTKDLEGFYALRIEYSNDFITPSLIIAPYNNSLENFYENVRLGLQLYKLIGTGDFFINGIYHYNLIQTLGAAISYDFNFAIINLEGAAVRYMKVPEDIASVICCIENPIDWTFLIGLTKNIESDIFVSFEYYYNGWGLSNKEFDDYCNLYKLVSFGIKKKYFSLNLSWVWDNKISFAITSIYGESDRSILLYPKIEYVENSNFNFEIGVIGNVISANDMDKETYYSTPFYNIISLKLKAYF